jgi:hypothetical protein
MGEDGKALLEQWDLYLVTPEVWKAAGMKGYASGHLCTPCLSKRLGRKLTDADYLQRTVGVSADGKALKVECASEAADLMNLWAVAKEGKPIID